ncbi:zinc-ribbon and DUF3426 domain-containing protein [Paraburkholderia phosphatilytica]|uniref:zinc-ribbon and DUF3426 domain-containing protein n=1 Tax=Paraburkholderia phosphatilytica TaxID=2282883 RepID=UPI0030B81B0D
MLLATRCPFCETVFRLLPAHLSARRGLVRCGHCQEVFDASGSLYELPASGDFRSAIPVSAETAAALTAGVELPAQATPVAPSTPAAASTEYLDTPAPPSHSASAEPTAPFDAGATSHEAAGDDESRETVHRDSPAEPGAHVTPAHEMSAPPVEHDAAPFGVIHAAEPSEPSAPSEPEPAREHFNDSLNAQPLHRDAFSNPPDASSQAAHEPSDEALGKHAGVATPAWGEHAATPPFNAPHDTHGQVSRPAGAGPDMPGTPPDFASPSWDPWAPPPDVQFDEKLRYSRADLPYTTFAPAVAPMRRPKQEMQRAAFEPHAHPEPYAEAHPEPHAQPHPESTLPPDHVEPGFMPAPALERELPPPHEWKPVEREVPPPAPPSPAPAAAPHAVQADAAEPSFAGHAARTSIDRESELREPREPRFGPEAGEPYVGPSTQAQSEPPFGEPFGESYRDAHREPAADPFNDPLSDPFTEPPPAARPYGQPFAAPLADDGGEHFAVIRETRRHGARSTGWTVLGAMIAVLLVVLLIAQVAWWQRESVMVYWPASQPLFAQACEQLGCTVAPPRDIDGLVVEPSDLREVENNPHKLELRMPLRNRFSVALAYPAVELTLLDEHNNIVVRRVLLPQDYVRPGTPIGAGLPAHSSQTMIVRLDLGTAVASNFLAQIFYP